MLPPPPSLIGSSAQRLLKQPRPDSQSALLAQLSPGPPRSGAGAPPPVAPPLPPPVPPAPPLPPVEPPVPGAPASPVPPVPPLPGRAVFTQTCSKHLKPVLQSARRVQLSPSPPVGADAGLSSSPLQATRLPTMAIDIPNNEIRTELRMVFPPSIAPFFPKC